MCFEAGFGSLFGLFTLVTKAPYSVTAIARRGSIGRYVTRDDFEDPLPVEPSLAIKVFQVVAAEVVAARKALSEMRLRIETQLIPQNLLA
jgi:CRP-like cAMP-binding protein